MNLDRLKELEGKTTLGWKAYEHPNELYWNIANEWSDMVAEVCSKKNAEYICALRNSAKEMIETIERYKAALEEISKAPFGWCVIADRVLKGPRENPS